jgi:acylphosphatase
MSDTCIVHLVIRGRVQGVGFRAWTQHQGQLRGLSGWVRNRGDGSVEALVSGPPAEVAQMVAVCRQGPRGSAVTDVAESPGTPALLARAPGSGFLVLPTA